MFSRYQLFTGTRHRYLVIFLAIIIVIGVVFRFIELDRKLFWHDEVYTNLRSSGYSVRVAYPNLFSNKILSPPELLTYQEMKPESTYKDTINSLKLEDPHHPPVYFLIARYWMFLFGSSVTASRFLPALISLLSLPLMYGLAWELFGSHFTSFLATAFLALSPFDILFAQTARQYSLLTVLILGSSYLLLKSVRSSGYFFWVLYSLVSLLGLYTHPFFALTLLAQGSYILLLISASESRTSALDLFLKFLGSSVLILLLYSPWIYIMVTNIQQVFGTTNWTKQTLSYLDIFKYWILNFTVLFIDIDFGFNNIQTYLLRLPFVILIVLGLYQICTRTPPRTRQFILTSIFVPFLLLALPDLLLGGRRSAITRYLVSCFPAIQLTMTYVFATHINSGRFSLADSVHVWRGILVFCFTASLVSCNVSAFSQTWWSKIPSYWNAEIARQVNAVNSPYVITDSGDSGINFGEIISLSYLLDKDVKIVLLEQPPQLSRIPENSTVFVFHPSRSLRKRLEQNQYRLEKIPPSNELWKISSSST